MSLATQREFESLVSKYHQILGATLRLAAPTFEEDGFVTTARLEGSRGRIELRCGPPEYHAELFVHTIQDGRRWSLADLMSIEEVRSWLLQNRPSTSGRSALEAEVECAFLLLRDGLRGDSRFSWLG
jgi:hypothetical protein